MLKGYFPVTIYARFEGISQDTAWHRVLRDEVESIIGKDGMRYVYYERQTAMDREGFIPLTEFCRQHDVAKQLIQYRLKTGSVPDKYVQYGRKNGRGRAIYIHKDYDPKVGSTCNTAKARLYMNRPDGYLTVRQWCDKNGFNYSTAQVYVTKGLIPVLKKGKHNYIPADFVYIRKKNKAHDEAKL